MPKIVYIAHEVGRNPALNREKILRILRKHHTGAVIPFAPYLTALDYLDDASQEERQLGMIANHELLRRGAADEIGVFGRRISRGMFDEIALGFQLGIPVRAYDEGSEVQVRYALDGLKKGIVFCRHVAAQRTMENGNALFFIDRSRDGGVRSKDLIVAESERSIDPSSGRDVSIWDPNILHYDEVSNGWDRLAACARGLLDKDRERFRHSVYGILSREYGLRPLDEFSIEEHRRKFAA